MFRVPSILVVLLAIVGSCIYFGTLPPAPELGVPPGEDELANHYDSHVGQKVLVHGTVVTPTPPTLAVESSDGDVLEVAIVGVGRDVSTGDVLTVYGTLEPDRRITADETVHKPDRTHERTLAVSFLAGVWVSARAVRHWRVDLSRAVVRRRSRPVSTRWVLGDGSRDCSEESDA